MKRQGKGRIVNLASAHGLVASPFKSAYVAAKHGVMGFTKTLALEVAEQGITCNAICPGYIATEMVSAVPEAVLDKIVSGIPAGRLGEAEEIGALTAFLCSDAAAFMTGSTLTANGGQYMV